MHARWATVDDANVEILRYDRDITVNKDGTAKEVITIEAKILNEAGRAEHSTYTNIYNHDSAKFEVLSAKTIYIEYSLIRCYITYQKKIKI